MQVPPDLLNVMQPSDAELSNKPREGVQTLPQPIEPFHLYWPPRLVIRASQAESCVNIVNAIQSLHQNHLTLLPNPVTMLDVCLSLDLQFHRPDRFVSTDPGADHGTDPTRDCASHARNSGDERGGHPLIHCSPRFLTQGS